MRDYREIAELVRGAQSTLRPSELAHLVMKEADGKVERFYLINVFSEAFPQIPFGLVIRSCFWQGVCEKGISDADFDSQLSPWLSSLDSDSARP